MSGKTIILNIIMAANKLREFFKFWKLHRKSSVVDTLRISYHFYQNAICKSVKVKKSVKIFKTRASYKNESREHFSYFSKIANLPQLSCLCLHIFVCLTRLKLSVSQYAYCTQSCNFKIKTKFKLLGQICNKILQPKCSRDSFL